MVTQGRRLKVEVDQSGAVYTTGDVVTGRVQYSAAKSSDLLEVSIVFRGKVQTEDLSSRNPTRDVYRELFSEKIQLYRGPVGLGALDTWEFAIPFPSTVPAHPSNKTAQAREGQYDRPRRNEHPMPPAINVTQNGRGRNIRARIVYSLNARVYDPTRRKLEREKLRLHYLPTSEVPASQRSPPAPVRSRGDFTRQTLRLLPGKRDGPLGVHDKARSLLGDRPFWTFRVTTKLPDRTRPGAQVVVKLQLEHLMRRPEYLPAPDVTLRSVTLALDVQSWVQYERAFFSSNAEELIESRAWSQMARDCGSFRPEEQHVKWVAWELPSSVAPDYETAYLRGRHQFKLTYKVTCLDEEFAYTTTSPVVIEQRASPILPVSRTVAPELAVVEQLDGLPADEEPPPYTEHA